MGKREKRFTALFRDWTPGVFSCEVLAGFSLNSETLVRVRGEIPRELDVGFSKVTVEKVTRALQREGGFKIWLAGANPEQDEPIRFWGGRLFESSAGSSSNIESVIRQLQRDRLAQHQQRVGILATIGQGAQADELSSLLEQHRVERALMAADGTNATLSLKSSRRQVMACEKRAYVPPPGLVDFIRHEADPKAGVFTGIRLQDFHLVQEIFWAFRNKRMFRVFGPHLDLLFQANRDSGLKNRLRAMIKELEILALSQDEALALVADLNLFGAHREFDPTNKDHIEQLVGAIAGLGAKITSVTLAEHGVAVMAGGTMYRHNGYKPPKGVRDTAGAGDAFLAALVYFYVLQNRWVNKTSVNVKTLMRAIQCAQFVAAHKVSHYGSSSGIPSERAIKL